MPAPVKTARNVQANRGIEAAYRRALQKLIADMHGSVQYWLKAGYRANPPRMEAVVDMAKDAAAAPSAKMKRILDDLAERWIKKFEDAAPKLAETYMRSQFKATDVSFKAALADAGWSVVFNPTPAVRDALTASMQENVGLIRSIPREYLQQVEGAVMRSYTAGRDLHSMVKELQKIYPKVGDRAALIARDQCNKANAVANRARTLQLGLKQGMWMHSGAGKHPRPSHVKAGKEKLIFDIVKGAYIEGEWIFPGQKIRCRCTWRVVLPI